MSSEKDIRKSLSQLANAPTPQNTPASVTGSYMKNQPPTIPSTISEENEELQRKLLGNPALLSMIQGKLDTLVGKSSGYVDKLPKSVKQRVAGLKAIQQKQFKIEAEFQSEILELEKKFYGKYAPLYEKRQKIISGEVQPTSDEIEEGKQLLESSTDKIEEISEVDEDEAAEEEIDINIRGIPSFWLTALENIPPIADSITDRDVEVLSKLSNIKLEYLNVPGFKLLFEFESNDFFENQILTKTYYYQKELGYSGDFIYDHAEGSTIKWKDNDHNVTITVERRKQRNKHTKQVRTIEKLTPIDSFFNFFDPPRPPKSEETVKEATKDEGAADVEDSGNDDGFEDVDEELEQRLALDYQLGELIKDKLIPRAIDWFTGDALQYEYADDDELDDEEFEEEEGDEEDEDDDSENDDEDESQPKSQPPECKQS
ncbi:BA75_02048T0 [Komagataella pastoris]|uniref:BA75_02048T0 n=1 Tax=Komagataella pastoris TaxID=4922 RepID=A0A1B2JDV5_PICPA|nr:BA75_02048T0 [Komagataella pastoris]